MQAECLVAAVAMMQAVCHLPRPDAQITTLRIGLNTVHIYTFTHLYTFTDIIHIIHVWI